MTLQRIVEEIKSRRSGPTSDSLTQFGIEYKVNYGVPITELRKIAEPYIGNHPLALELFKQDIRECKIIASIIDDPTQITGEQIDEWAQSFTNVEIVEQVCSNVLWKADCALSRSIQWCLSEDNLLIKAGLLVAAHSATNLQVKDVVFEPYLEIISSLNEDLFANNKNNIEFALRQIANRNQAFRAKVIELAVSLSNANDQHRAWVGDQLLFEFGEE
jgi:3-methyladenine DNA glycosylase AlkD